MNTLNDVLEMIGKADLGLNDLWHVRAEVKFPPQFKDNTITYFYLYYSNYKVLWLGFCKSNVTTDFLEYLQDILNYIIALTDTDFKVSDFVFYIRNYIRNRSYNSNNVSDETWEMYKNSNEFMQTYHSKSIHNQF